MKTIYAISDIHGFYNEMIDSLSLVDLKSNPDHQLIFMGDYLARGYDSCLVLYHIKKLTEDYPDQVVVLLGNHEQMFLEWYFGDSEYEWLLGDVEMKTVRSFLSLEQWEEILKQLALVKDSPVGMSNSTKDELKKNHAELFNWLYSIKNHFYYETDDQIFVHAGISEVDPELWKHATEESEFTWKYPPETGSFYKDIIAGHTSSASVAKNDKYLGKVYWDGYSHYFIDGQVTISQQIPLLKYDSSAKTYSSFDKREDGTWFEYLI